MKRVALGTAATVLVLVAAYFFSSPKRESAALPPTSAEHRAEAPRGKVETSSHRQPGSVSHPGEISPGSSEPVAKSVWKLDSANFEHRVFKCFQGEACELEEDPLAMYRFFKKNGNRKATDLLISYLRSHLKDASFAARYKDALKAMIDDFYPLEEKQFQEAAYYNYLGDLKQSLTLYLDLEKKAAVDASLRPAPKLNIANTYYDLGRSRDALPYYQAALDELTANPQQLSGPDRDELMRFVEGRIEEIRAKLGSVGDHGGRSS